MGVTMMLKIEHISKKLSNNLVLDDLSLTINSGSVFGLVGINGAGKSTLLRCIAGIYSCDSGTVTFNDTPVFENEINKKDIFFVSDDPFYPINSTILDLKRFYKGFYEFDEEIYSKYLQIFKLKENVAIHTFSKGMKRQVFILMALAISPKLLILDEAFDGLDPFVRLTFKKSIVELIESKNMTIIISSHNLRELEDICDSFAILENHQICTSGDIMASKDSIHKIQLAYKEEIDINIFDGLDTISIKQSSRVVTLVVKGEINSIKEQLNKYNPVMLEVLSVSFEELFLFEMQARGYSE